MKIEDWKLRKEQNKKISMLTCYDYTFAQILNESNLDAILVGDSSSMVIQGDANTIGATTQNLSQMCNSVSKGAPDKFIVCDLPFGLMQMSDDIFFTEIKKILSAGANAVKVEGIWGQEERIKKLIQIGVPVMGHLGLTPQHVNKYGGFKLQGKNEEAQNEILESALALQQLGVFAIVLECIPKALAELITHEIIVPTIGIGAGSATDGQILVLHDFLGLTSFKAKFVRHYLNGRELVKQSVDKYVGDVNNLEFPMKGEYYD